MKPSRPRLRPSLKPLGVLVTGAAATQAIPLVFSPVLARLYSPEAYGATALLTAVVGLMSAVATGRYHQAIMIPRGDPEAFQIARASLRVAATFALACMLVLLVLLLSPTPLGPFGPLGWWILMAPPSALLGSTVEVLTVLNIRLHNTASVARSGVSRTGSSVIAQLLLATPVGGKAGLIIGSLVGSLFGNGSLLRPLVGHPSDSKLSRGDFTGIARRYRRFPIYDTWGTLANIASSTLLVLGLASVYTQDSVGQYAIAYRTLTLPLAVIGTSVASLLSKRFSDCLNTPRLASEYRRAVLALTVFGLPMFLAVWLFCDRLFTFVFGAQWLQAGQIAAAMAPLVAIRFVASPVSSIFSITESQGAFMILQVGLLVITAVSVTSAGHFEWDIVQLFHVQALAVGSLYAMVIGFGFLCARRGSNPKLVG